jgi:hypothetical protein
MAISASPYPEAHSSPFPELHACRDAGGDQASNKSVRSPMKALASPCPEDGETARLASSYRQWSTQNASTLRSMKTALAVPAHRADRHRDSSSSFRHLIYTPGDSPDFSIRPP